MWWRSLAAPVATSYVEPRARQWCHYGSPPGRRSPADGLAATLADALHPLYCENMKNITVTVSDDLYKAARLRAAERQSTVSALVRGFLEALTDDVSAHERLRQEQNEIIARIRAEHPDFGAGDRLSRDEIHRRDAIR